MCTGSSAVVRSVTAAAAACGSRFSVTGSMSANTGRARSNRHALALATNENGEVTTSSPSVTPTARSARCRPAVPLETALACATPSARGERLLERRDARAERELPAAQDLDDRLLLRLAQHRPGERDDVLGRAHAWSPLLAAGAAGLGRAGAAGLLGVARASRRAPASDAAMTFSATPIVPHTSVPSEASISTRVVAPVPVRLVEDADLEVHELDVAPGAGGSRSSASRSARSSALTGPLPSAVRT